MKQEVVITWHDIDLIIRNAKRLFVEESFPVEISKKTVDAQTIPNVMLLQAFLDFAQSKGLLDKSAHIDYTRKR